MKKSPKSLSAGPLPETGDAAPKKPNESIFISPKDRKYRIIHTQEVDDYQKVQEPEKQKPNALPLPAANA